MLHAMSIRLLLECVKITRSPISSDTVPGTSEAEGHCAPAVLRRVTLPDRRSATKEESLCLIMGFSWVWTARRSAMPR